MSELDANIIVDGQKTVAATQVSGEIIKSGGEIDATCRVQDSDGKKQLFNDLPTVSGGQKIQITDATGASDLTAEDEAIATGKGWTITK